MLPKEKHKISSDFRSLIGLIGKTPSAIPKASKMLEEYPWLAEDKGYEQFLVATGQKKVEPKPPVVLPPQVEVALKFVALWKSAQRRGKEFNLTLQDVNKLLHTKACFYTGTPLTREPGNNMLTVDRVDNTKGYVKGNVVACCHLANQIKNKLFEEPSGELRTNIIFMQNLIWKLAGKTNVVKYGRYPQCLSTISKQ